MGNFALFVLNLRLFVGKFTFHAVFLRSLDWKLIVESLKTKNAGFSFESKIFYFLIRSSYAVFFENTELNVCKGEIFDQLSFLSLRTIRELP